MALDNFLTLGRSGLKVSPLCLGAMTFGEEWGFGASSENSVKILDRYFDLGGNFVDTANMYTRGHSEAIIGDHLAASPGCREQTVIATKFSGNLHVGDPNGGGASRKSIMAACEQSLRRLKTDYIDLYWMHWWDAYTPIEETMRCLDDLVRAGKVRYIGFSDTPAWRCAHAHTMAAFRGWTPLIAMQLEYSLLQRTIEGECIPMAQELGLGVTPWSPLAGGALSGKYSRDNLMPEASARAAGIGKRLNDRAFDIIDVLNEIAGEIGHSPAHVALAWTSARPGITSPIIGVRTMEQLESNIASLDVVLSTDHMARLNKVSKPHLPFPASMGRQFQSAAYGGLSIDSDAIPQGHPSVAEGDHIW